MLEKYNSFSKTIIILITITMVMSMIPITSSAINTGIKQYRLKTWWNNPQFEWTRFYVHITFEAVDGTTYTITRVTLNSDQVKANYPTDQMLWSGSGDAQSNNIWWWSTKIKRNVIDPLQNTIFTVDHSQTQSGYETQFAYFLETYFEEVNDTPSPVALTSREINLPAGRYTVLRVSHPTFTKNPDKIRIEYRRYITEEWQGYMETDFEETFLQFQDIGGMNETNFIIPGYYRACYEWLPPPEESDTVYSNWTETQSQVQLPGVPPEWTLPETPVIPEITGGANIQIDNRVNPMPQIWNTKIGKIMVSAILTVISMAMAAYFVWGKE